MVATLRITGIKQKAKTPIFSDKYHFDAPFYRGFVGNDKLAYRFLGHLVNCGEIRIVFIELLLRIYLSCCGPGSVYLYTLKAMVYNKNV